MAIILLVYDFFLQQITQIYLVSYNKILNLWQKYLYEYTFLTRTIDLSKSMNYLQSYKTLCKAQCFLLAE